MLVSLQDLRFQLVWYVCKPSLYVIINKDSTVTIFQYFISDSRLMFGRPRGHQRRHFAERHSQHPTIPTFLDRGMILSILSTGAPSIGIHEMGSFQILLLWPGLHIQPQIEEGSLFCVRVFQFGAAISANG